MAPPRAGDVRTSPAKRLKADEVCAASAELDLLLDVAIRAVAHASNLAVAVQAGRRARGTGDAISKDDSTPVTVADYGVQCLITEFLAHATGAGDSLRLVAEEDAELFREGTRATEVAEVVQLLNEHFPFEEVGARSHYQRKQFSASDVMELLHRGRDPGGRDGQFWVLDPIDGTKGFVRDAQYAIGLGLVRDGEVILGTIASPSLPALGGDVTRRAEGQGWLFAGLRSWAGAIGLEACRARLREPTPPPDGGWRAVLEPLRVAPTCRLEDGVMCESYEASHSCSNEIRDNSRQLKAMADLRLDSMSKYGLVARGEAHVYLRGSLTASRRESIWDHCPGVPIVLAAGGEVTDLRGRPLDFGCGRKLSNNVGVLATNGSLHAQVLAELQRQHPGSA